MLSECHFVPAPCTRPRWYLATSAPDSLRLLPDSPRSVHLVVGDKRNFVPEEDDPALPLLGLGAVYKVTRLG
jgi:hypothetical protein